MSDWAFLNKHRVHIPGYPSMYDKDGFCGAFMFPIAGEERTICCVCSDGSIAPGETSWQHVSVSFGRGSTRTPSWEIMCKVKDLFWEPEDWVIQFHPAHSEYVNQHPGCLHLWKPIGVDFPKPPSIMAGFK